MCRKLIISTLFLFLVSITYSQIWNFARIGSEADIVFFETDSLGNCYIGGTFDTTSFTLGNKTVNGMGTDGSSNTFLFKINPAGKLVWLYSIYGETGSQVQPIKVAINQHGEMLAVIAVDNSNRIFINNNEELFLNNPDGGNIIMKIGKTGIIHWSRLLYLVSDTGSVTTSDAVLTENGNCFVSGYYGGGSIKILNESALSVTGSEVSGFIMHITPFGTVSRFRNISSHNAPGTSVTKALHISVSGSFLYLAGTYNGSSDFFFNDTYYLSASNSDAFIAQYSIIDFSLNWLQQVRGVNQEEIIDIKAYGNNDALLVGLSNSEDLSYGGNYPFNSASNTGNFNVYAVRISEDYGMPLNSFYLHTELLTNDYPTNEQVKISIGRDSSLYVAAEFDTAGIAIGSDVLINALEGSGDILLAKFNPSLNPVWARSFSEVGNNELQSSSIDRYGNFYTNRLSTAAVTYNATPIADGPNVFYCSKVNSDGELDYTYTHNNDANSNLFSAKVGGDVFGNIYFAGSFNGSETSLDDNTVDRSVGIILGKYSKARNIAGSVQDKDGNTVNQGMVKIYGYAYFQNAPLNDSVSIQPDGSFDFQDIPVGDYLVVAIPSESVSNQYTPTYFPSARYWENGVKIRIRPLATIDPLLITMIEKTNLTGRTRLNGSVQNDDDVNTAKSSAYNKAKPQTEANVVLAGNRRFEKTDYEIVAITQTDASGNFSFYNIEDGTYYLWVDMPGLPCDVHEVIVNGNQLISNINYLVTESEIIHEGSPLYASLQRYISDTEIKLYPNPAVESITIHLSDYQNATGTIYDSRGRHVMQINFKGQENVVSVQNFKPGSYFMQIITKDQLQFRKFTIVDSY